MGRVTCTDQEFIALFESVGPTEAGIKLGVATRSIFERRLRIEIKLGIKLIAPPRSRETRSYESAYPARVPFEVQDGTVLVGSDAHYWPDLISCAHRGFVRFCERLKPKAAILNGDGFDGAKAGRHPPIGWTHKPSVNEELGAVEERTDEIRHASPTDAELVWTMGNHDLRFENTLAKDVAAFNGVKGMMLKDHFPHWKMVMSLWINGSIVVKHRYKGGVHATHNNTLQSGRTIVTGHLHSLKVTPFDDYDGTRYGVDTGTLADPFGPQFDYGEDNPNNHRSGFAVLTFKSGKLLMPELAKVVDKDHIEFRGEVIEV